MMAPKAQLVSGQDRKENSEAAQQSTAIGSLSIPFTRGGSSSSDDEWKTNKPRKFSRRRLKNASSSSHSETWKSDLGDAP